MYYVYILFSEKLSQYYIGQTNNLEDRINRHNSGYETFTSKGLPWKLLWFTKKPSRSEAMILERKLKNLSQVRIREFIKKYNLVVDGSDDASMSEC